MAPKDIRQVAFSQGEYDPRLYGRSDLAQYAQALRLCHGWLVDQRGALLNRPGTVLCGAVKDSTYAVRLEAFDYSLSNNLVLEFGHLYVRVWKQGVLQTPINGGTDALATPYQGPDLWKLKFAQSGDEIVVTHPSYEPRVLKRTDATNLTWTIAKVSTKSPMAMGGVPALTTDTNYFPVVDTQHPGRAWRWVTTLVDVQGNESDPSWASAKAPPLATKNSGIVACYADRTAWIDCTLAGLISGTVLINLYKGRAGVYGYIGTISPSTRVRQVMAGGSVASGPYFEDTGIAPDFSAMPQLRKEIFVSPAPAWTRATRYSVSDQVVANSSVYECLQTGWSAGTGSGPSGTGAAIDDGAVNAWAPSTAYALNDEVLNDGEVFYCTTAGTSAASPALGPWMTSGLVPVNFDGTAQWMPRGTGIGTQWKYLYATGSAPSKYPYCCTHFEQRRMFGGSDLNPSRVLASRTSQYGNFVAQGNVTQATDPVDSTLASLQREEVRAMASMRTLLLFTSHGVWNFGGANGGPLVPNSIDAHLQVRYGISWLDPIIVGNTALYVQSTGNAIRDLTYAYLMQNYDGEDVTTMSRHLFESYQITDWAYQKLPDGTVWCIRSDGVLLGLTYNKEQKIKAWHWHDTGPGDGTPLDLGTHKFESVCSILEGSEHAVYVTVNRAGLRYVERFATRVLPRLPDGEVDVSQGTFTDASKVYTATAGQTVFAGLGHLEGLAVWALVNGGVAGPLTVAGGSVTLPAVAAGLRVVIGLEIPNELETLDLIIPNANVRSNVKTISRVSIELVDSLGLQMAAADRKTFFSRVDRRVINNYGTPTPFTGLDHVRVADTYDHGGRVVIRQNAPLPATIVGIGREVDIGGD
jgi:hypothetical protein